MTNNPQEIPSSKLSMLLLSIHSFRVANTFFYLNHKLNESFLNETRNCDVKYFRENNTMKHDVS